MARFVATSRTIFLITAKQLWDRKLLNTLAVCGVMLGVLVFVVLSGLINGFQHKFLDTILKNSPHVLILDRELGNDRRLVERHVPGEVVAQVAHEVPTTRDFRIKRPKELVHELSLMPGVVAASASIPGNALAELANKSKAIELRGITLKEQEKVTPIAPYVTAGVLARLTTSSDALVMGSGVAKDIGAKIDDVVHVSSGAATGRAMDLKVVAIFDSGTPSVDRSRCYVLLRNAQSVLGRPDDVGLLEVRLTDPKDAVVAAKVFEDAFGYDAESWQETNAGVLALFATQDIIIYTTVGAIMLVGGFGIMAVQVMIVLQKQRDIAILRAVGLRGLDILIIFQLQGLLLTALGALIGDGLGKLALVELAKVKVKTEGALVKSETIDIYNDPRTFLYGFLFALTIGVIASFIPAWRGGKVEPVQVLRGQIG